MKKVFALALALALVFSMASVGMAVDGGIRSGVPTETGGSIGITGTYSTVPETTNVSFSWTSPKPIVFKWDPTSDGGAFVIDDSNNSTNASALEQEIKIGVTSNNFGYQTIAFGDITGEDNNGIATLVYEDRTDKSYNVNYTSTGYNAKSTTLKLTFTTPNALYEDAVEVEFTVPVTINASVE